MLTHLPIFKTVVLFFFPPMTQLQPFHYKLLQLLKGNFFEKVIAFKSNDLLLW